MEEIKGVSVRPDTFAHMGHVYIKVHPSIHGYWRLPGCTPAFDYIVVAAHVHVCKHTFGTQDTGISLIRELYMKEQHAAIHLYMHALRFSKSPEELLILSKTDKNFIFFSAWYFYLQRKIILMKKVGETGKGAKD